MDIGPVINMEVLGVRDWMGVLSSVTREDVVFGRISGCVSSRQSQPARIETTMRDAHIKFGSRYGNFRNSSLSRGVPGKLFEGVAK